MEDDIKAYSAGQTVPSGIYSSNQSGNRSFLEVTGTNV
jgi:hypothetical protein